MMTKKYSPFLMFFTLAVLGLLVLSGCAPAGESGEPQAGQPTPTQAPAEAGAEEDAAAPPANDEPYPAPEAPQQAEAAYPAPEEKQNDAAYPAPEQSSPAAGDSLPPDPQPLEFESGDGTRLSATFYPAASSSAPIVVLMHQFGRDRSQWDDLALWLQNRGQGGYEWFPPMPEDLSLAVLTFDFRGHGQSGNASPDDAGLLMDAQAALAFAKTLPGVDPNRVLTIGTSIGADGAVDACVNIENAQVSGAQQSQGCIGALSFSPGNYIGVQYQQAANALLAAPHNAVVYCLAAEADGASPATCKAVENERYQAIIFPGGDHGVALLRPDREPDVGQLVLDFILQSLGLAP